MVGHGWVSRAVQILAWWSSIDEHGGHQMTRTTYLLRLLTLSVQSTEPWTHDPKGTLKIGRTFKVILLTEEVAHEGIWAKVERYLLYEKQFHMLEFKFPCPTGIWGYEFSSVQEVYEAIIDSSDSVIPNEVLALLSSISSS